MTSLITAANWWMKNLRAVILILLPALIPTIIINSYLYQRYIIEENLLVPTTNPSYSIHCTWMCIEAVDIMFTLFWLGVLVYYMGYYQQSKFSYKKLVIEGIRRWLKLFAIIIIAFLTAYSISLLSRVIELTYLEKVGQIWAMFIFLLFPWRYGLIMPVAVLENHGIIKSFKRSAILSEGVRIHTFLSILGFLVIKYVLLLIFGELTLDLFLTQGVFFTTLISKALEYLISWLVTSVLIVILFFIYIEKKHKESE